MSRARIVPPRGTTFDRALCRQHATYSRRLTSRPPIIPLSLMTSDPASASITLVAKPTRVRYKVAGLTFLLAMITYLDRVCIATVAPSIMADFPLTKVQMGYIFSAFALAYAAFEIPTARFADKIGTHAILTRIVVWWSAFTLLTGATFNFLSLLVARFLFGAGEAGAWPCAARTFARWIPKMQRGTLQGIFSARLFSQVRLRPCSSLFCSASCPVRFFRPSLGHSLAPLVSQRALGTPRREPGGARTYRSRL